MITIYTVSIVLDNKRVNIGLFTTPEEAYKYSQLHKNLKSMMNTQYVYESCEEANREV